jgi:tetratricopeptide (TPR) repeat protein
VESLVNRAKVDFAATKYTDSLKRYFQATKLLNEDRRYLESLNLFVKFERDIRHIDKTIADKVVKEILNWSILSARINFEEDNPDFDLFKDFLTTVKDYYCRDDQKYEKELIDLRKFIDIAKAGTLYNDGMMDMKKKSKKNKAIKKFKEALAFDLSEYPDLRKKIEKAKSAAMN